VSILNLKLECDRCMRLRVKNLGRVCLKSSSEWSSKSSTFVSMKLCSCDTAVATRTPQTNVFSSPLNCIVGVITCVVGSPITHGTPRIACVGGAVRGSKRTIQCKCCLQFGHKSVNADTGHGGSHVVNPLLRLMLYSSGTA
jgi:hypothetical protein